VAQAASYSMNNGPYFTCGKSADHSPSIRLILMHGSIAPPNPRPSRLCFPGVVRNSRQGQLHLNSYGVANSWVRYNFKTPQTNITHTPPFHFHTTKFQWNTKGLVPCISIHYVILTYFFELDCFHLAVHA